LNLWKCASRILLKYQSSCLVLTSCSYDIVQLTIELKENEVAMSSLRENLEERILLEQGKNLRQAQKALEEQAVLSNELNSAKHTVKDMQKQLERENKMVEEFEEQVERLNADITRVQNDNRTLELELKEKKRKINDLEDNVTLTIANVQEKEKEIESLRFSLREREKESAEFSSNIEQMRKSLLQAEAQIKEFQQELDSAQKELGLKDSSIKNLSERLASAVVEREDNKEKLVMLHQELNQMKLKFDKDLVSARQAVFAKQEEINQLKEKLNIAYDEAKKKDGILAGLQEESSTLKSLLEEEKTNVKHLSSELQRSIESLEALQSKVITLSSELTTTKRVQAQVESEIARLQNDRDAMRDSLEEKVHEAEQTSIKLSSELASVKKALNTARNDLLFLNKKLEDSTVSYENIKQELSQARKTVEVTSTALNEEKKVVAALSQELEASEKSLLEEKEGRRVFHRDFEEVTKSMEDMRICLVSLSEELEIAKSKINSLETENASLYESMKQEKHLSKELQESAGHANKILMKLGREKETYVKKARKLEEELSSAKGEILRLRKQITIKNTALEEARHQKDKEIKVSNFRTRRKIRRKNEIAVKFFS
jgi:chromosome segregation ATPase